MLLSSYGNKASVRFRSVSEHFVSTIHDRSLEVAGHGAVEEFGDGDVVVVVLEEFNHQHVVVLVDRHVVLLSQELSDRNVVIKQVVDGLVIEQ